MHFIANSVELAAVTVCSVICVSNLYLVPSDTYVQ